MVLITMDNIIPEKQRYTEACFFDGDLLQLTGVLRTEGIEDCADPALP